MMRRRNFLTTTRDAGLGAGAAWALGPLGTLLAGSAAAAETRALPYDLIAVRNGDPAAMFDAGIAELGGIRRFVKPNATVVIKPNIGWDAAPERAANTNPRLVGRIVEQCVAAGAKQVYCFDYTCDNWRRCYRNSGIERAVKDAGGTMVPGNNERYYHPVEVDGKTLRQTKEHELVLESDLFINVPVLKSHGGARLTISMKNLMGAIWDRRFWHRHGLHQCIADFAGHRRPDLNVVDAYDVMMRNGPKGVSVKDVKRLGAQLISTDMVTADAAAARLFGLDPRKVDYIPLAADGGAGRMDLENLRISRVVL
jgi:uncharacterized protein (DUF362 family)